MWWGPLKLNPAFPLVLAKLWKCCKPIGRLADKLLGKLVMGYFVLTAMGDDLLNNLTIAILCPTLGVGYDDLATIVTFCCRMATIRWFMDLLILVGPMGRLILARPVDLLVRFYELVVMVVCID
jgi:hypothetical protein